MVFLQSIFFSLVANRIVVLILKEKKNSERGKTEQDTDGGYRQRKRKNGRFLFCVKCRSKAQNKKEC